MSPRTEEQYREIREEKKALIREAALELFAKGGYHATSISKIAEKANISKGLIYNYFDSKEDVIKDLLDEGIQRMLGGLDMNKDGILQREEVENYLNEIFDIIKANPEFWKLYFSVSLQPAIYNLVKEKIEDYTMPIFKMITNYFKEQDLKNPETETMIFAALLDGIGFHFIMDPENYPIDRVKKILIERYVKFSKTM